MDGFFTQVVRAKYFLLTTGFWALSHEVVNKWLQSFSLLVAIVLGVIGIIKHFKQGSNVARGKR